MDASQAVTVELGVSLNGTHSCRSVISTAPPAAIVHPVGLACVTFFYYNTSPLWQISAHWAVQDAVDCLNRQLKMTTVVHDWWFSTRSGVKCIKYSQNISKSKVLEQQRMIKLHTWLQGQQNSAFGLPNQTPSSLLNIVDIALQQCNEQCSRWIITPQAWFISKKTKNKTCNVCWDVRKNLIIKPWVGKCMQCYDCHCCLGGTNTAK